MPDMKNFFGDATNQNLLFNHLNTVWKARIIRVPLCMSRYHQNNEYVEFIQQMVDILNKNNMIAILDAHVWDKDWTADNCPSNDKPGITVDGVMNTPGLFDKLKATWTSIASRYKDYSNVFFELFNEPRVEAPYVDPKNIDWKQWQDVLLGFATTVRTVAPNNVLIVGGLNWSYTFFVDPENASFKNDFKGNLDNLYGPFSQLTRVLFNVHPYQHASCCGIVTDDSQNDLSKTDPYYNTNCSYFFDHRSQKPKYFDYDTWSKLGICDYTETQLYPYKSGTDPPQQITCSGPGVSSSDQDKLPPCNWIDYNILDGQTGYCAGDTNVCKNYTNQTDCNNNKIPAGWDKNLFIKKYGPMFMTEFGTYDCSTPFVSRLLDWAQKNNVGWTVWALWPGNSGGPGTSGNCGFPSVIRETPAMNLSCSNNCEAIKPLGRYGELIKDFMQK